MTLKALTEVVKSHGKSISHINHQISAVPDIQMFKEFEKRIEEDSKKSNKDEIEMLLQDKISRKELQTALSVKINKDQLKEKLDLEEFYSECKMNNLKIEKIQAEFNRKLMDISMDKELQKLNLEIKEKPS